MTIQEILDQLPKSVPGPIPAPAYTGTSNVGIALAVESMKRHTTDEGWQIMAALEHAGYKLCGQRLAYGETDVNQIIQPDYQPTCSCCGTKLPWIPPGVVVVQDKREWDVSPRDFRDKTAHFIHSESLKDRLDLFKLTILKDAHHRQPYHREAAEEIGAHAWIIYYHPAIVQRLAPYIRREHLIRTYHSLDAELVPPYQSDQREGAIISGAVSGAYPLRSLLVKLRHKLPKLTYLPHPGYHMDGTATPEYLKTLSRFKVAICTASIYGYALRKIIEATACGCIVITNLPSDEVLPEIDGNLVRIQSDAPLLQIRVLLRELSNHYDADKQKHFSDLTRAWYDYRTVGLRLARDIEQMRQRCRCI